MLLVLPIINKLRIILSNLTEYPIFFFCLYVIIPFILISSLICVLIIFHKLNSIKKTNTRMEEIHHFIKKGAKIYLTQQAKTLFIVLIVLFIPVGLTGIAYVDNSFMGFLICGLIFFLGAISSLVAGYVGMKSATKSNILVVKASIQDPNQGFKLAYYGGMITGIMNISMLVFALWLILLLTNGNIYLMISYNFGTSVTSLLAQVGGGIFTKSADIGADLVGKYEMGIKEDDARNPAIIADLVGDNVGDCAGRGADLFDSATSDAIGGMLLGLIIFLFIDEPIFILSDITIISIGLLSLYFTALFLKIDFNKTSSSIWRVFIAAISINILILFVLNLLLFGVIGIFLFFSSLMGLTSGFLMILFTIYYTNINYKYTKRVAEASQDSSSLTIIAGISAGFQSTFFPVITFVISIIIAYFFGHAAGNIYYFEILGTPSTDILGNALSPMIFSIVFGIWGVNMGSVSTDIIISTILSFDTFGPIIDNAAGIVELGDGEAPPELRGNLDKLDAIGNTTKAIAKGFSLICGGFSSIVIFLTFLMTTHTLAGNIPSPISFNQLFNIFNLLDFYNPLIILGLFVGFCLPVLFSSMILRSVQNGAKNMMLEVRRQFKDIPGLKEGNTKPDYEKCINISSNSALRNMIKPVLTIIGIVLIVGILFGPMVSAAILMGNLIGCLIFGLFMNISGASFDNAKKGIEAGLFGGRASYTHKSAIIGDTVGDALKDAAGPSMSILITTINTLSITFLPIFIMTAFLWNMFSF